MTTVCDFCGHDMESCAHSHWLLDVEDGVFVLHACCSEMHELITAWGYREAVGRSIEEVVAEITAGGTDGDEEPVAVFFDRGAMHHRPAQ